MRYPDHEQRGALTHWHGLGTCPRLFPFATPRERWGLSAMLPYWMQITNVEAISDVASRVSAKRRKMDSGRSMAWKVAPYVHPARSPRIIAESGLFAAPTL